jgi:hypothetical protein
MANKKQSQKIKMSNKKNKEMRKIEFEVSVGIFGDFAEKLEESGLNNRVLGKNEDHEIKVEVYFDKGDEEEVDQLEDAFEALREEEEDK